MRATAMSSCSTAAPAGTASSCSRRRSALDLGPFEARMSHRVGEGCWERPAKPQKGAGHVALNDSLMPYLKPPSTTKLLITGSPFAFCSSQNTQLLSRTFGRQHTFAYTPFLQSFVVFYTRNRIPDFAGLALRLTGACLTAAPSESTVGPSSPPDDVTFAPPPASNQIVRVE